MDRPLIAVLNGPNMNMLGLRQPHLYGSTTLDDVEQLCADTADALGLAIDFRQTNGEGEIVTWVQECRGRAAGIVINPAGDHVVTAMQENALHGWRLTDGQHMRMSGYPAKPRSLDWSHDGLWLATSGADAAIVWPFDAKTGPMGKAPRECGLWTARVSRVAFHPNSLVLAVGYEDGAVLLIRLTDAAELLVRKGGGGPISAFAWDAKGRHLAFGGEDGGAGILTLPT
jgi:WD40 repeat protein